MSSITNTHHHRLADIHIHMHILFHTHTCTYCLIHTHIHILSHILTHAHTLSYTHTGLHYTILHIRLSHSHTHTLSVRFSVADHTYYTASIHYAALPRLASLAKPMPPQHTSFLMLATPSRRYFVCKQNK